MKVKEIYLPGRKIIINKGDLVRVWHDPWMSDIPLKNCFPMLFDVCQQQNDTLAEFVSASYEMPFRRRLFGELTEQLLETFSKARDFTLNSRDTIAWSLTGKGLFTTKSIYEAQERFVRTEL